MARPKRNFLYVIAFKVLALYAWKMSVWNKSAIRAKIPTEQGGEAIAVLYLEHRQLNLILCFSVTFMSKIFFVEYLIRSTGRSGLRSLAAKTQHDLLFLLWSHEVTIFSMGKDYGKSKESWNNKWSISRLSGILHAAWPSVRSYNVSNLGFVS